VAIVNLALGKKGMEMKAVERWKADMPTEAEMRPKDKYTFFDKKEKGFRKGVHGKTILLIFGGKRESGKLMSMNRIAEMDEGQSAD
jgi:hypothetical protein